MTDILPVAVFTSPRTIDIKSGLPFSNRTNGGIIQSYEPSLSGVCSGSTEFSPNANGTPPLVAKILIDKFNHVGVRAFAR